VEAPAEEAEVTDVSADLRVQEAPADPEPLATESSTPPRTVAESAETSPPTPVATEAPSLETALAELQIPPPWYDEVEIHYDTDHPWKDARLEIRRLLGLRGESSKEAMKLTCIYREKDDIGDGHEYPMYLYMGGEYAWATKAYVEFTDALVADPESYPAVHAFLCLASCYVHFKEYEKALETLEVALSRVPDPPWKIMQTANVRDYFGDAYVAKGDLDSARKHYQEAVRLYPQAKPPYGGHLLKRRAAKVQSKLDMLDYQSLSSATLRDGTYHTKALAYSGDKDLEVTLTIVSGRIADIGIEHAEKIDQGATEIIPQRIIARQSLEVDGITGATVTCDAILDGVFRALKQAGLE